MLPYPVNSIEKFVFRLLEFGKTIVCSKQHLIKQTTPWNGVVSDCQRSLLMVRSSNRVGCSCSSLLQQHPSHRTVRTGLVYGSWQTLSFVIEWQSTGLVRSYVYESNLIKPAIWQCHINKGVGWISPPGHGYFAKLSFVSSSSQCFV